MQSIASENNLPETAFVAENANAFDLHWFTPEEEINLCGHATLATAFVLNRFVTPNRDKYLFHSMSVDLTVTVKGSLMGMDFPSRPPQRIEVVPEMTDAVGATVLEAHLVS